MEPDELPPHAARKLTVLRIAPTAMTFDTLDLLEELLTNVPFKETCNGQIPFHNSRKRSEQENAFYALDDFKFATRIRHPLRPHVKHVYLIVQQLSEHEMSNTFLQPEFRCSPES